MKTKKLLMGWFLLCMFFLTGCGYAGPEKAVQQEMDQIRKLDESTISNFISYEDITAANASSKDLGPEATQAVKLFFKNFKYRIVSSSVSEDQTTAEVTVSITNIDAKQLAKDLCLSIIQDTTVNDTSSSEDGLTSSFALMQQCLESNSYPLVTTKATVNLVKQGEEWIIPESTEFEDDLTGGLVSYLQDPYLLTPEDVLDCTLSAFSSFDTQQWYTYLNSDDILSTGSDLANEIDLALCEQIARFFDYTIDDASQDGDKAQVSVTITSLDLEAVMSTCKESLLDYAQTTESIRATDEEISQKNAELLLKALQENEQSAQHSVTVSLVNNGYSWELQPDELFSSALIGGVVSALELFE